MDRLDQYRIFAQIAEMGSFIKTAHALELPRASVSAAIQQLEAQVGTRLLHRTTRQVHLTADGMQLLERIRPLLADVENIDTMFQASQRQVSGQLRIDVPSRIARRLIVPALPVLLRQHPQLRLILGSSDRAVDLVREGIDCVVRAGALPNTSLAVRPLGLIRLINCASPAYLQAQGIPEHPDELCSKHWMVGYASPSTGRETPWSYISAGGAEHCVPIPSQVVTNNAENYIACCRTGLGLIQIPVFDVQHLIDAGELQEVMPEHRAAPLQISLLYPHRRQRSRRLAVFMDWFEALMKPHLQAC
ncbi:LysR family transcriptional regulator [Bordetella sp. J329]|jgi:DNA-binding transcriptional LysR family regulator|uniref:LysR family transcriptional regulator n=1 Tax=Kerstersia gyiorum TaxID=206506 RepID=UPI000FD99566|nr:LysR family transcriptional regulator [Kerstersia gyiorum]AZV94328.1 LysR family transcriptional regulator [Bordetella sp. J329]MCH4272866.1 LysR family transcriptional regulator [Kerstersia gyiorum]MCI1229125.1 LysR family transcriptional regulator [Kerstersia gyiorum]